MTVILDLALRFPCGEAGKELFDKLVKLCGSVEAVESYFGLEFSCGDGKYFSDMFQMEECSNHLVKCTYDPEGVLKYDGQVCLKTAPRVQGVQPKRPAKTFRFTVKQNKSEEYVFFLNSTERYRRSCI